jgi:glycosyltransferase involved in cell wall biosynthesis
MGGVMTRLVVVTQVVDPADPVLGVTMDLVRALKDRSERVVVIANEVRRIPGDLGADVISLGKEDGVGRVGRGIAYQRALWRVARDLRPHAFLAHMCPIYLNLAAPLLKLMRIRALLWFAYPRVSPLLRGAEFFSDCVVTALPESYPRRRKNVFPIGHAIDVSKFKFVPPRTVNGPFKLLSIARTAPEKHHDTTLRAVASAINEIELTLRIVGASTTEEERQHRHELRRMIRELDLETVASLEDPVPRSEIPGLIAESDCIISAAFAGGADKAVLEAMSVGRPTVVSNPAFDSLLNGLVPSLRFREADSRSLADRVEAIARTSDADRSSIGRSLSRRVRDQHSLDHWADKVMELARYGTKANPDAARP